MRLRPFLLPALLLSASTSMAAEFHVAATTGNDANPGTADKPLLTIMAAANKAQPGDTITVHAGIYREQVVPPRGGLSREKPITYQAAQGEKVVVTGSETFTTWEKVSGDTWKLVLPNAYFGDFNPYAENVNGDWFNGRGRVHRRGNVYLNGDWLAEAPNLDAVNQPSGAKPMWFSVVDGLIDHGPGNLMNITTLKTSNGTELTASKPTSRKGTTNCPNGDGTECVGYITSGCWLHFEKIDFGTGADSMKIRASAHPIGGGIIELRDGHFDGPLFGTCEVPSTGGWENWQDFTVPLKNASGIKDLYVVFKSAAAVKAEAVVTAKDKNTTIYAQFPGTDPNKGGVEVSVRPTVFTPAKTNINYITLRGFDLRNAATNWAAPTMGQFGLVTAYWNKGWIIENNEISYSRCGGIALGKYSDEFDGRRGTTEGYYLTIEDALKSGGWTREKIGSHLIRNNHIHHCGQVGIVGSLGCAFSRVEGNDIHDCNMQGIWTGAEMAGIKFHGAIDAVITGNHIHHNGEHGGLWLDWMAQGTQVTNNLFHDNNDKNLFAEVNHGPFLVANNIFVGPGGYVCNSEGAAFAHNLVLGRIQIIPDSRKTPWMKPHDTQTLGLYDCPVGDARWFNNLLGPGANLAGYDGAGPDFPVTMSGNVFTKGSNPSKFETEAIVKPEFDSQVTLTKKDDGWYLTLESDPAWSKDAKRKFVTSELLGKAKIPNMGWVNPDGSSVRIDTDYFGRKRTASNPFPGPFNGPLPAKTAIKVWPRK